jgi:hypothetical protein
MGRNTVIGKKLLLKDSKGMALLWAVIAVNIFAILSLMARSMWETEIQRDYEEELLFRARQYRMAIEFYVKENNNLYPRDFDVLYEKKYLRQLFKDPMSDDGKWNYVMRGGTSGKDDLLIVPEEYLPQYIDTARIVGVASTSPDEGFREYRGKKRYSEWAVYVGEQVDKEMPELKFIGQESSDSSDEHDDKGSLSSGGLSGNSGSLDKGTRDTGTRGEEERE